MKKGGYYAEIIRPQIIENESDQLNKNKEDITLETNILTVNNEKEIHFELRDNKIAISPEDVHIMLSTLLRDFCKFKKNFIMACVAAFFWVCFKLLMVLL